MSNPTDEINKGVGVAAQLIQIAGDNPDTKKAALELGKAAHTISKSINVVLLPLAAVNFAYDKAKFYFKNKFEEDLSIKTKNIPEESIVEPKPSVAGPAMQGISYSLDEPNLKDMYLSLLANSMDGRISSSIHPAFVEIIRQMNSEEANLFKLFSANVIASPVVRIKIKKENKGYRIHSCHVLGVNDGETNVPVYLNSLESYVNNWIRLGLVEVTYTEHLTGEKAYNWVSDRPEYSAAMADIGANENAIDFDKGLMRITAFGKQFRKAVGIG